MLIRKKARMVWIYRTMVNGKTWERSTGEIDRKKAEMKVSKLRRLAELHRQQPADSLNLDQAIVLEVQRVETDVSELQAQRVSYALMNFREWAGNIHLERISPDLIEQYQRERLQVAARSTVAKELDYLARLLRKNKISIPKPSAKPGRETELRELSTQELESFFKHCPKDLRSLFLLMLVTGARPAELVPSNRSHHVALLKKEVNLEDHEVTIRSSKVLPGKKGEVRTMGIPAELAEMLKATADSTAGPHVFPDLKNPCRYFNRIIKDAGIAKKDELGRMVTAHSFRHTFATMTAQTIGGNQFLLQRLLGHKDIKTSARYCHLKATAKVIAITPYLQTGTEDNG
jgi:integrase